MPSWFLRQVQISFWPLFLRDERQLGNSLEPQLHPNCHPSPHAVGYDDDDDDGGVEEEEEGRMLVYPFKGGKVGAETAGCCSTATASD